MNEKTSVLRALGMLVTASLLLASPALPQSQPYVVLRVACAMFLVACAIDYLTKGRRTAGGALDRNAWMPSSWRKGLFGSTGKK
jgi:hypothetical protein